MTMKKHFLLLAMAILPIFANASVEINGIYYNLISESHSAEVTSGTNNYSENYFDNFDQNWN